MHAGIGTIALLVQPIPTRSQGDSRNLDKAFDF
jgi:hypothetical protein